MKKVLSAIGATVAFLGMASFAVFFMETSFNVSTNLPASGLAADIAANVPAAAAPAEDVSATADNTAAAPAPGPATSTAPAPSTSQPASQETSLPPAPPVSPAPPTPPALPILALADTSTVATVTITVAPTAPINTPPNAPSPSVESSSVPDSSGLSLPYRESNFTGDNNWRAIWGSVDVTQSGFMDMTAGIGSTGGTVYLKNSESWTNYLVSATVDWVGGQKFGLMADYQDANNYILCQYEASSTSGAAVMSLEQYRAGNEISLTPSAAISWDSGQDADVSVKVDDANATCSFNGNSISNSGIGPGIFPVSPSVHGGIGFTMQDQNPNVSQIIVKAVSAVLEF